MQNNDDRKFSVRVGREVWGDEREPKYSCSKLPTTLLGLVEPYQLSIHCVAGSAGDALGRKKEQ